MYLGIDTHKRYLQVAVVDSDGNMHDEIRLPNDHLDELAEQYAGSEAAIEASGTCRPIYEMLDEHLDVTLVNPSKNRIIADATIKTDRVDAKRLAHMLRADMLAESYVPPDEIRILRDLVRTRKSLAEARTAEKKRVRAVLTRTDNSRTRVACPRVDEDRTIRTKRRCSRSSIVAPAIGTCSLRNLPTNRRFGSFLQIARRSH